MEFIRAKKIVQSVTGGQSWFGVNYNMNIYKGCNQGCIYCDSRSNCYQIPNFDKVRAKENADIMVDHELSSKRKIGIIGLGGMSDPYNNHEIKLEYTRNSLKSMAKYGFGTVIITKNTNILRDIDVLKEINKKNVVNVGITITTADDKLRSRIETNSPSSSARFKAIKTLSDEGIYCGILMMPILPFINDTEENIKGIIEQAAKSGAKYISPSFGVTLRDNQRQYYFEKIGPKLTKRYVDKYQEAYSCASPNHKQLRKYFETLCKKYGILYKMSNIVEESLNYVKHEQLTLF
ncbi:radical SAM protein [Candidatus Izimaplasma bacterium]|nr:radical SAM protein [Candidatus Izimaplasma bacterium]